MQADLSPICHHHDFPGNRYRLLMGQPMQKTRGQANLKYLGECWFKIGGVVIAISS
jgi:hypothetical protein